MCDTIVACKDAVEDGTVLFGKNSDREPDEAQNIEIVAASDNSASEVQCTHVRAPLYRRKTCAALLCRPFRMYGAEMGVNEYGVAIGNEALFTREKPDKTGLTGMDLLRLALVQSRTAGEARDTIIRYLSEFGQGGKAGHRQNIRYMNGYIIADPDEAYVLETVKSWWAWKRITGVWSISNIISLRQDFDECAPGLIENAVTKGYAKSESNFDFQRCYSDRLYTKFARGRPRAERTRRLLSSKEGGLFEADFFQILRDHGDDPEWRPYHRKGGTVCMHATNSLTRPSQTVGSMVASLAKEKTPVYVTAAANPCMGAFFPVSFPEGPLPDGYKPGGDSYDPDSYFWQAERINRKALAKFEKARAFVRPLIEETERETLMQCGPKEGHCGQETVNKRFEAAQKVRLALEDELAEIQPEKLPFFYRRYWNKYNRKNGVPVKV